MRLPDKAFANGDLLAAPPTIVAGAKSNMLAFITTERLAGLRSIVKIARMARIWIAGKITWKKSPFKSLEDVMNRFLRISTA